MTLKQKNILLVIGFSIILLICLKIPIKQTVKVKRTYNSLLKKSIQFSNTPVEIALLKKEEIYLDSILNSYQFASHSSFQSNLLQSITSFANNHQLNIITFKEPHEFKNQNSKINTYVFSVKGGFTNALKLLYDLEQVKKLGKIGAVSFEKKKNYKTNRTYLVTTIMLQRIDK